MLVFDQLSGLNSSRFAHTESIAKIASTVVNTISPLTSQRRRLEIRDPDGASGAAAPPSVAGACSGAVVDGSSLT